MLGKCRNRVMLRKALSTLPPTLDQTYERILSAISEEDREYAVRILQWLTFSKQPLTIREVAEVVAIDVERDPAFDRDEVLEDPLEVLDICSSLVTVTDSVNQYIALAHYSVKEYIVSDRIKRGPANQYSMQPAKCHSSITKICLKYLLQLPHPLSKDDFELAALSRYSAEFWASHLRETGNEMEVLSRLAMELMPTKQPSYLAWIQLYSMRGLQGNPDFPIKLIHTASPLYHASFLGLSLVTKLQLEEGADVNAQGGPLGNALEAASQEGHEHVVKVLLNAGANVNAQGGALGNALCVASQEGHEQVVKTLLAAGAIIDTSCAYSGNALHRASAMGHESTVKTLLNAGADVNAEGGHFGNALQAAVACGYKGTVRILVEAGADVNSGALETASVYGYENFVEILLEAGAQANAEALQAASERGRDGIVKMLIEAGAEPRRGARKRQFSHILV
jgi:ankyrin repeat protein